MERPHTILALGRAALDIIKARPDIDLLFTDVIMPNGRNGVELARQARLRPALQIVYASGCLRTIPLGDAAGYGPLIPKPWQPTSLASQIRSALTG